MEGRKADKISTNFVCVARSLMNDAHGAKLNLNDATNQIRKFSLISSIHRTLADTSIFHLLQIMSPAQRHHQAGGWIQ